MSYYLVLGTDRAHAAALREQLRPAHRQWLREHPGHAVQVLLGGPTLDAAGRMNGTLLVVQADSEAEVRRFLAADPYGQGDLFERVEVRRWQWSLGVPAEGPS